MAFTTIASITWGSSPPIPATFYYESQRNGSAMEYKVKVVLGAVQGERYFGFPIYLQTTLDGVLKDTHTLKAASPSQWSDGSISYTSGWLSVPNKYSGTVGVRFRLYSGSGSTRDNYYPNKNETYSLPVEAQISTLTITSGYAGQDISLSVTRYGDQYTHDILYTYDGNDVTVCSGDTGDTYTVTPSWATIVQSFPSAQAVSMTFTINTYSEGTLVGTASYPITCPIRSDDYGPTAALTVSLDNTASVVLAGWGEAVAGYTKLAWDGSGSSAAGGASITNYAFAFGSITATGATSSGTTGVLQTVGTIVPTLTVTDSRGFTDTVTLTGIEVYQYNPPIITAASAVRCDSGGTPDEEGTYLKCDASITISDVNSHNTKTVTVAYKQEGGAWSSPVTVTLPATVGGGGISVAHSYAVKITATDAVGNSYNVELAVPTATITLHMRTGGLGVGIGKYVESDNLFDVAWDTTLEQDLSVGGDAGVTGDMAVGGDTSVTGDLDVGGAFTVGGQPLEIDLENDVTGILKPANGGLGSSSYVDISSELTFNKSSGSSTVSSHTAYKWGKLVQVTINLSTTASISAGSTMWFGLMNGHSPLMNATGFAYIGSSGAYVTAARIATTGNVRVHQLVGTVASGTTVSICITYLEA